MSRTNSILRIGLGAMVVLAVATLAARGQDVAAPSDDGLLPPAQQSVIGPPPEAGVDDAGWDKPIPLEFGIDYTIVSDYVWRGINLSEYANEGTERLNHQLNVGIALPTESFGTFAAAFWFEWYGGQEALTPDTSDNLQEVDYTLSWSYDVEPIFTSIELGWIAYTFPQSSGDLHTDYDAYVKLGFDDSPLFGTDEAVLNLYFAYFLNLDLAECTSWMEFGISHDFGMGMCEPLQGTPLEYLTVTPSLVVGIDHRSLHHYALLGSDDADTSVAFLNYGLALGYDLSGALEIPEQYGSFSVTGFLNFSQAIRDTLLDDEFYGGMTLSYAW